MGQVIKLSELQGFTFEQVIAADSSVPKRLVCKVYPETGTVAFIIYGHGNVLGGANNLKSAITIYNKIE